MSYKDNQFNQTNGVSRVLDTASIPNDPLDSIREELREFLERYNNDSAAFASFERYSGLNRKTLKGFLATNRRPYPNTILCFYKWFYKTNDTKEIVSKMRPEFASYLAANGLNIEIERKDITSIITRSSIHLELYLLTEDQQIIKKEEIQENYGLRGIEAANDLLMEDIILSLDGTNYTTGKIRSDYSAEFFEKSSGLITNLVPWGNLKKDPDHRGVNFSLGNVIVTEDQVEVLDKAYNDFVKKLCDIHEKSMKKSVSERQSFVYSVMTMNPLKAKRGVL